MAPFMDAGVSYNNYAHVYDTMNIPYSGRKKCVYLFYYYM